MTGLRRWLAAIACLAILALTSPAQARPGPFVATLWIQVGSLPPISATGSAIAQVGGIGGPVS